MAITTKMTEVQNGMTFGYSDTCNTLFANGDWTASELARFSWCRWNDRYTNCLSATTIDTGSWQGAAVCNMLSYFQNNGGDLKTKYVDDLIPTQQPYAFNILMYGRDNDLCLTSSNAANYRVVTSCSDFQKLYVQVDEYKSVESTRNVQHPTTRTIDVNRLMWSSGGVYNTDTSTYTNFITVWTVFVLDENTFFVTRGMAFPNREPCIYDGSFGSAQQNFRPSNSLDLDNTPTDDKWQYSSTQITTYDESKYLLRWYKNGLTGIEEDTWTAQDQYGCWDVDSDVSVIMHGSWGNYQYTYALRTENAVKNAIAYTGLRWKYRIGDTEHIYTPIIDGDGYITGWSTDPNVETKLNDIIDVTGNNISPTPPTPPTPPPAGSDDDNDDHIPVTGAPYSSGLARYYVTTAGSTILNHISEAMGAWNLKDTNKDLYKNIISCKLIKSPAPIPVSGSEPFTLYGVTLQYEGSDITLPLVNDNPTASFGSYTIPRKFNDFRDYAPYTKVEIYLPYCGWTVLPSHVVGRSVSVTYYTDIIAATCKAVVYCGSNVIAEAAGVIGLDIPMVTENAGAKAEAVTMGLLAYGKAGLQTALGVGAAVASKGKVGVKSAVSGLENLVSAYSQTAMAFNQNYTEINGKNGDGCCIAGISAIVIKITRPKYGSNTTAPYVPSEYGHATGFVSMKSAKVGSFTGLLVADNVDTSGISGATDREKQLIKLYLESGIYVNHPN